MQHHVLDGLAEHEYLKVIPNCNEIKNKFISVTPESNKFLRTLVQDVNCTCDGFAMEGYYFTKDGIKKHPPALHSQVHSLLGHDFKDMTTSTNDVGVFT